MRNAKILTFCLVSLLGCSVVEDQLGIEITHHLTYRCKNRAYANAGLEDYISSRFHSGAPVRLGIIPFAVPANFSGYNSEMPGIGNTLSWKVQAQLLDRQIVPIVEVLNRASLPGHKDEFFTGNFGSIDMAREAGYDLVMIGYLEPIRSLDEAKLHSKIIEVESGVTVYYGESTLSSNQRRFDKVESTIFGGEKPSLIYSNELFDNLARCVVEGATDEESIK